MVDGGRMAEIHRVDGARDALRAEIVAWMARAVILITVSIGVPNVEILTSPLKKFLLFFFSFIYLIKLSLILWSRFARPLHPFKLTTIRYTFEEYNEVDKWMEQPSSADGMSNSSNIFQKE